MENEVIIGWVLSTLAVAPFFWGGFLDVLKAPVVIKNTEHIGFPFEIVAPFGVIKILIGILSLIPSTSFVGVILATGWMGGAIAAHIRVRDKYFIQVIIPILIWIGFGLRHQSAIRSLLGF